MYGVCDEVHGRQTSRTKCGRKTRARRLCEVRARCEYRQPVHKMVASKNPTNRVLLEGLYGQLLDALCHSQFLRKLLVRSYSVFELGLRRRHLQPLTVRVLDATVHCLAPWGGSGWALLCADCLGMGFRRVAVPLHRTSTIVDVWVLFLRDIAIGRRFAPSSDASRPVC
jgi:hypothetical protein